MNSPLEVAIAHKFTGRLHSKDLDIFRIANVWFPHLELKKETKNNDKDVLNIYEWKPSYPEVRIVQL